MNQQDLARLETDAAEIVGAMKDLFKEFERRLGEIISAQRIASSEALSEGARVAKELHELNTSARTLVGEHREFLARVEREWQLRIDSNARRAGEVEAKAFGENIARGLQTQLAELALNVENATRSLTWKSSLRWVLGIAIAIPLTVGVCVGVFLPHREEPIVEKPVTAKSNATMPAAIGLTPAQTREAVSRMSLCQAAKTNDWHACIEVDSPPRMGFGSVEKPRVVVRGM
jgi:hypothetical protein